MKRYEPDFSYCDDFRMTEDNAGEYVLFTDHSLALEAERKRVERLVEASRKIETWIVAHPRKATIVREVVAEFRAALAELEGGNG